MCACRIRERERELLKTVLNEFCAYVCANKSQRHAHLIAEKSKSFSSLAFLVLNQLNSINVQHTTFNFHKRIFSHPSVLKWNEKKEKSCVCVSAVWNDRKKNPQFQSKSTSCCLKFNSTKNCRKNFISFFFSFFSLSICESNKIPIDLLVLYAVGWIELNQCTCFFTNQ